MISNKISQSARNYQEYLLHIAALEWSIQDTITIADKSDIKSQNWLKCNLKPFEHQYRNLIYFFRKLPCALIADDVGLGKTISAGMILSELMTRQFVTRTLIVAPKLLCSQWVSELKEHFGLPAVESTCADFYSTISNPKNLIITATYETMRSKAVLIQPGYFQLCIFDEAHKFRNLYGTNQPPKVAINVREALKNRIFKYVLMLTATPMQNRIWDLYSLIDLLKIVEGEDNPLGSENHFLQQYLENRQGFHLKPNVVKSFRRVLQRNLCRTRRLNAKLPFPTRELKDISYVLSYNELAIVNILKEIIQNERICRLTQISLARALFSSPQALLKQLENSNSKNGEVFKEYISRLHDLLNSFSLSSKMTIVLDILSQLRDNAIQKNEPWRAVIFTVRLETLNTIADCLKQHGFSYSTIQGGNPIDNQRAIKGYSQNPPEFNVIISTDAGAEGVNLQAGNVVINYDLPWNPMVVEQRIGRVQRLGSKYKNVLIFNPYAENSIEGKIVHRLLTKLLGIAQSLGELESILESANWDDDKFEKSIESMILNALTGQNVQKSLIQKEESFQRGLELYQKNLNEIEQKVPETNWKNIFSDENKPPKLAPQFHSMTEQDFLAKASAVVNQTNHASTEFQTIDNYQTILQNPEFIKQVSYWKNIAHEFVFQASPQSKSDIISLAITQWNILFPDTTPQNVDIYSTESDFYGQIYVKSEINNAIDRYQKEIPITINPEYESLFDMSNIQNQNNLQRIPSSVNLISKYRNQLESAIQLDTDICQFNEFYERKLEKKLTLTTDEGLKRTFKEEYENKIYSEANAINGVSFNIVTLTVLFEVDGYQYRCYIKYNTALMTLITPAMAQCQGCLKTVPVEVLQKCNLTEQYYLPHYLIELPDGRHVLKTEAEECYICNQHGVRKEMRISPTSHKYGHIEHLIECDYSHKLAFPDEMVRSDYSQRLVLPQYIQVSEKSGRNGVIDEFELCSLTHKRLLKDELCKRDADGLLYDKDLLSCSPVSGRYELTNLMKRCELTNTLVIEDELVECCISHKKIRIDKAAQSPVSKKYFIPQLGKQSKDGFLLPEFEICELCDYPIWNTDEVYTDNNVRHHLKHYLVELPDGRHVLKTETEECYICNQLGVRKEMHISSTSHKYGHKEHLIKCAYSHKLAFPDEMVRSDYSQRLVLPQYIQVSEKSGRKGVIDEFALCSLTHKALLKDELCKRCTDGLLYDKDLLSRSPVSGRYEFANLMKTCELTNTLVIEDELVECCISHKKIRIDKAAQSPVSKKYFIPRLGKRSKDGFLLPEFELCNLCNYPIWNTDEVYTDNNVRHHLKHYLVELPDGRHVLKTETEKCYICNQYGVREEMLISSNSHKHGHKEHLIECDYSHKLAFPDEMVRSDYSRRLVLPQYIQVSEKSGRKGVIDEFELCTLTHKALLKDELRKRYTDGLLYDKDLLSRSPVSSRYEFANLMKTCELTNTLVIEDELVECCISHKKIRMDKAAQSPISKKYFIPRLGKQSEDGILLPEFEICNLCNYPIWNTDEVYTDNNVRHHLVHYIKSAITGKYLLPSLAEKSDYSQKYAEPEYFEMSQLSGRKGLPDEIRICAQTQVLVLVDETCYSERDKQWYRKDICKQSAISHSWGLQSKMVQCEISGNWLFLDESVKCALSGKRVMKSLTIKSAESGKYFCKDLAIKTIHGELIMPTEGLLCPFSNGYLKKSEMGKCKKTGLVVSKRFLVDDCLYTLNVVANAINGNETNTSVWKPIPKYILNALQKLKVWDFDFNLTAGNIDFMYWPLTKNIMTFYAVKTEKKILGFISTYTYFYGVFEIKDGKIRILGQPEKCKSSYKIGE